MRNTPGTSNHLAVLKSAGGPSVTGPTQVVEASFASTDNQGAPKVGLVLRYKDPDNFYLAYRKAGPASFLRIAKVVAGTETVLTQLALPSPQVNTFFRLTATAVGTTLTLDLNGVSKLSVDDLTFSNGSVGVVVDPGTSATAIHRVNDFTANVQ